MDALKCYLCGNSNLVALHFHLEGGRETVDLVCVPCGYVVYNMEVRGQVERTQKAPPWKYRRTIRDRPTLNKLKRAEERIEAMAKYQDELHEMIRGLNKQIKDKETEKKEGDKNNGKQDQ